MSSAASDQEQQIARWPTLVIPWLDAVERRATHLPRLASDCSEDDRADAGVLYIDGLVEGATLQRPPGSAKPVHLQLRALGSETRIDWLWMGAGLLKLWGQTFQRDFPEPGTYLLTALAEDGAWNSMQFRVLR